MAKSKDEETISNLQYGFEIFKNSIVTPLLMAKERVVEYMRPEKTEEEVKKSLEEESKLPIEERFEKKMQFDDVTVRRLSRKRLRVDISPGRQPKVSRDIVNKARGAVEFIAENTPLDKTKITNNFVTNLVELSDGAINKLSKTPSGETNGFNMRFIKPSK